MKEWTIRNWNDCPVIKKVSQLSSCEREGYVQKIERLRKEKEELFEEIEAQVELAYVVGWGDERKASGGFKTIKSMFTDEWKDGWNKSGPKERVEEIRKKYMQQALKEG